MRKTKVKTKNKRKKKKKTKVNWKRLIITLIIIALVVATITQFLYFYFKYSYKVIRRQVFEMKVQVDNYVGINVDKDTLNFGVVLAGGGSKRFVDISSNEPTRVIITMKGPLADWTSVSENNFIFEGKKTLTFLVNTPKNATKGIYEGEAILIFKKP